MPIIKMRWESFTRLASRLICSGSIRECSAWRLRMSRSRLCRMRSASVFFFLGSGFQDGVWRDAGDKVGAQVGEEVCEFAVAEDLNRPHDGRCVYFVAFCEFPGGEEIRIFGVLEDHAQQFAPAGAELVLRLRKARFQAGLSLVGGVRPLGGYTLPFC